MLQLKPKVVLSQPDMFGAGMVARLRKLEQENLHAMTTAAQTATRETRNGFTYRRDIAPPRPGRSATGGQMRSHLKWVVREGGVDFDVQHADAAVPHWIIQEVGTGETAVLRNPEEANPVGRPKKGASYVRRIPSQVGRRLPGGLVFASGGIYSPTGSASQEQIHLASTVTGVPRGAPAIKIRREIEPQHMVREGGTAGFRQYRSNLLSAARTAFQK